MDYLAVYMASKASKSMTANQLARKRASAERGAKKAMYELALAYKTGDGVKKDSEQFFELMRKAALAGHSDAILYVAYAYEDGEGTDPNIHLFFEWIKKAAETSGGSEAIYNLALAYKDGKGTEKDDKQFFEWIKKAAERNNHEAMYHLAAAYEEGVGTDRNLLQYFEWTKKIANLGEPGAMLRLAEAYKTGKGAPSNNKEFYRWTKKAVRAAEHAAKEAQRAAQNEERIDDLIFEDLPTAMYNLAMAYRAGTGTNRHIGRYFGWMKKAAEAAVWAIQKAKERPEGWELGDVPTAMYKLASAYKDAEGTKRSTRQYFDWMKRAAEVGLPAAMVKLAFAYRDAKTSPDIEEYCRWMEKAAKAGDRDGMYYLALAYGAGTGKPYNTSQFSDWIDKAVKENQPDAFIAQGIAELQKIGFISKDFMPFFQTLNELHTKVRKIQKDHIVRENSGDVSTSVAHYTVLPALYSMLPENPTTGRKASSLRLYNIAYVNDLREGKRLVYPAKESDSLLANAKHLKEFFPDECEIEPESPIPWQGQKFSVYIGSFALAPDRLDLWRAYGQNGEGYCIVMPLSAFDQKPETASIHLMQSDVRSEVLEGEDRDQDVVPTLYEVYYKRKQAEDALARLAGTLRKIKKAKDDMAKEKRGGLSPESLETGKGLIDSTVRTIVSGILYLYKDEDYENEKEVRMLKGSSINAERSRLDTEDEHAPARLYLETRAFLFDSENSHIIIGPRVKEKTAVHLNLQKRLASNNLRKTQVKVSEIQYR